MLTLCLVQNNKPNAWSFLKNNNCSNNFSKNCHQIINRQWHFKQRICSNLTFLKVIQNLHYLLTKN